jgi:hypothetical protein
MNYSVKVLSIGCVGEQGVRLMDEGEVVDDVSTPVGEMASLRTIATDTGEESIADYSGEVTQPTESVGTKHVSDRALQQDRMAWLVTLPCVANRMSRI